MSGFIKIHRQLLNWEWYHDKNVFRLFIHFILRANYKNTNFKGITIKRGQLVTGLNKLSDQTGLSVQQIRTVLKKLKSTKEILVESNSNFSVITLNHYDIYQANSGLNKQKKQVKSDSKNFKFEGLNKTQLDNFKTDIKYKNLNLVEQHETWISWLNSYNKSYVNYESAFETWLLRDLQYNKVHNNLQIQNNFISQNYNSGIGGFNIV